MSLLKNGLSKEVNNELNNARKAEPILGDCFCVNPWCSRFDEEIYLFMFFNYFFLYHIFREMNALSFLHRSPSYVELSLNLKKLSVSIQEIVALRKLFSFSLSLPATYP